MNCILCNSDLVEMYGIYGTFYKCSKSPKCKYTISKKKINRLKYQNKQYAYFPDNPSHWWDESLDWEQHY